MIEEQQTERADQSFEQAVGVIRRRFAWIIVCVVLAAGAAFAYSKSETKKYTATAALSFSNSALNQQVVGLSTSGGGSSQSQQASNLELVKVGDTAANTARLLGHGLTDAAVRASLSIGGQTESTIVEVSATSTSPALAAAIANTYASEFTKEQQNASRHFFKAALALVNKQLSELSPAQRFSGAALDLQQRGHTLRLLAELGYNKVAFAQEAVVPTSPSSPKAKRDTILGAIVGLLLGLAIAFLLERFDHRIREPEELEAIYRSNLLGFVPKSAALSANKRSDGSRGAALPYEEAEAFSLICAQLRFFNVDRAMRIVAVASPAPDDGKTTIARHLAGAAARLGSRVLLLEADMRRPAVGEQLGLEPGAGLSEVLTGAVPLHQATRSVNLDAAPGEGASGRRLDVLTAGAALPPNPGELLAGRLIGVVLDDAKSAYELIVIDTPPLLAVSDAFPLLTKVDGVVVVGWIGRSRRDAAEQLQRILAGSGAPLIGVIANGSKPRTSGSYAGPGESSATATPRAVMPARVSSPEGFAPTPGS